ncbi:MAG: thiamine pyrophosphate-binding protein [Alphaproteobacteria bacterium]
MKTGSPPLKTGGELVVKALGANGVHHIFCVPGESYLAVLDALYDTQIAITVCRQEGGAAMMADAYGKMTGRPGICMVTRGPGAANAAAGVHVAAQDSTPMILFVGQVARGDLEREAFQEIDYRAMFGSIVKWVAQIDDAGRVPEFVARAFATATGGRPGPVVLALPEDMLRDHVVEPQIQPVTPLVQHPGADQIEAMAKMLARAKRPLVILGPSGWTPEAIADLRQFAQSWNLPVAVAFRAQDTFDNDHDNYVGDVGIAINPALANRVREADVLLVVGARLGEMTTSGFTLLDIPVPRQKLIHVHPGAEELGRIYQPSLAINASLPAFATLVAQRPAPGKIAWESETRAARAQFIAWTQPIPMPGPVQLCEIMTQLRARLADDAIVCNGAGNYAGWLHRFFRYRTWRSQLAPTSGSMGYGLPAAVAAARLAPQRTVVALAGDGCAMMTIQELATAVQYQAKLVLIVVNNAMLGTIRMHQEKNYPGRVVATDLTNPDFAALARAFGAHGETVRATNEFAPALERALKADGPALIEIHIDRQAITPSSTLSALRGA